MMKIIACILGAWMMLGGTAWAKHRNPSSLPQEEIVRVIVVFGEKTSEFSITESRGEFIASYKSNQEPERRRMLTANDVQFVISKLQAVPAKATAPGSCSRKWISAQARLADGKLHEASDCLSGSSPASKALTSLADLLASSF